MIATTDNHNRKWVLLGRPSKRGHRFFVDQDNRMAVADNSGRTPDDTEDGALWLDTSRRVEVSSGFAGLPVIKTEDHKHVVRYVVHVTMTDISWLVKHQWVSRDALDLSDELRAFLDAMKCRPATSASLEKTT